MLAAATGGCATTPASRMGAASDQAAASDLDSYIYGRSADQQAQAATPQAVAQRAAVPPTAARARALVAAPAMVAAPVDPSMVAVPVIAHSHPQLSASLNQT